MICGSYLKPTKSLHCCTPTVHLLQYVKEKMISPIFAMALHEKDNSSWTLHVRSMLKHDRLLQKCVQLFTLPKSRMQEMVRLTSMSSSHS